MVAARKRFLKGLQLLIRDKPRSFYRCAADAVQKILKSPKQYRLPDLSHSVKVVSQVMQGGERGKQNFAGLEQVTQVCARIGAASVAAAVRVYRRGIVAIARLL